MSGHRPRGARTLRCVALAGVAGTTITIAGCSASSEVQEAPSATLSASRQATLPDGIPVLPGASLAQDITRMPAEQGTSGWTAVAILPRSTTAGAAVNDLQAALTTSGWPAPRIKRADGATTLSYQSPASNPMRYLVATVTPPLPGGGYAVTYRYVKVAQALTTTPSRSGGVS